MQIPYIFRSNKNKYNDKIIEIPLIVKITKADTNIDVILSLF